MTDPERMNFTKFSSMNSVCLMLEWTASVKLIRNLLNIFGFCKFYIWSTIRTVDIQNEDSCHYNFIFDITMLYFSHLFNR